MFLIDDLIKLNIIKSPEIAEAFKIIRREDFLTEEGKAGAEIDAPIAIGYGQTNSQPTTVAMMLELLSPKHGERVLDVGCGSGWTTALLTEIVGGDKAEGGTASNGGKVYGLELICELAGFARVNVEKYEFITKGTAEVLCADGYRGLPEHAPFDKILVSAAAEKVPIELLRQLKTGGRMVIPVGRQFSGQDMLVIGKINEDEFREKRIPGFVFVPLVKK